MAHIITGHSRYRGSLTAEQFFLRLINVIPNTNGRDIIEKQQNSKQHAKGQGSQRSSRGQTLLVTYYYGTIVKSSQQQLRYFSLAQENAQSERENRDVQGKNSHKPTMSCTII